MKTTLVLALFLSLVACFVHSAATNKEALIKLAGTRKKCQEQHKVDWAKLQQVYMSGKEPETENEKCVMSCLFSESGTLKDGKIDFEKYGKMSELKYPGNSANIEKSNNIMKRCTEKIQNNGNDCNYVSSLAKCSVETSKAEGLPLPDYEKILEVKTDS